MTSMIFYFFSREWDAFHPLDYIRKLKLNFRKNQQSPKISTCGYTVVLPMQHVGNSLEISLKFSGGCGAV